MPGPLDPARYRELFDGVQDILYVRDIEGVLLDVNEAAARFFGVPRDELIGKTLHRRTDDSPAQSLQATNEILFRRGIDRSTVELQNAAGDVRVLEATTTLVRDDAGRPAAAYGVMRDVTDSVRLQKSLAETNDALLRTAAILTLEKERAERGLAEAERMREVADRARAEVAADHERKTRELEDARAVHLALLPHQLPRVPHIDVAVHMQSATEVGGDYYDFSVGEDGSLTVVTGDATGHGLKAGILVATAKSYFQTLSKRSAPREILHAMSIAFGNLGVPSLYMCLMLLRIHERQASVLGAGMPPFFVRRPHGAVERIEIAGTPLGVRTKPTFDGRVIDFDRGTSILLFSDGLPDLANESDCELGYERIEATFAATADGEPAEATLARVVGAAAEWCGRRAPADDLTAIVLRAV